MRRFLTALMSTALLVGVLAIPVSAAGPKCVDLLGRDQADTQDSRATYNGSRVAAQIFIAGDQCRQATYTLYVLESETDTVPFATGTAQGTADGTPDAVEIFADADAADTDVCVYVESSIGRHVFDRAPAEGCVTLFDDGSSPGGGKGF
ncbi:MAG: hypothetical protein K5924_10955 [Chloroflexi bacterium]|nr:hypothetical protein [Chloroflexota bacterium]